MLAASQDIDSFIERQRSKLNAQPGRPSVQRPAPPPPQPSVLPTNVHDRLDFKVARILEEPAPRIQQQQPYYPSSPPPPPFMGHAIPAPMMDYAPRQQPQQHQQQFRRLSNDAHDDNPEAFFNKFGTYDDKRSQLKDDLKREYNEYLQSQKPVSKSKSTSQLVSSSQNNNRRVQFQPDGKVVAPWEKREEKGVKNVQSLQDLSSSSVVHTTSHSYEPLSRNPNEQYIRDREEYIIELHAQIRELESRKKQLEMGRHQLSAGGSSTVNRAHYAEDLNALNSLLEERLDQRNAVDSELAHILNRPPITTSSTRIDSGPGLSLHMPLDNVQQGPPSRRYPQQAAGNQGQAPRKSNRAEGDENRFQIGRETDKDSEQAAKKRYQQELQAQMREAQLRKAQAKNDKDEYDRKMDAEVQRYNYFGRSGGGGGAPMRDKEGNVVANLADLRNPPASNEQQQQPPPPPPPSHYSMPDDRGYSLGNGASAITNAPFYNGEPQQANSDRPGSPNHTRGAVSNGIFGASKTEAQVMREEKYKQELKQQIEERRQREIEETARRRADEERELAKHVEWQQQAEKQSADDAQRKQERDAQDRQHQQHLQEGLEQQKKQEEIAGRRKPKRTEKPKTPPPHRDDADDEGQHDRRQKHHAEPPPPPPAAAHEPAFRSSSPPIPTLNNKGKKAKGKKSGIQRPPIDEDERQPALSPPPAPLPPFTDNDGYIQMPSNDASDSHSQQTYRKPPTPRQPDIASPRKKAAAGYRAKPRPNSNMGMHMRPGSATSLRSDGSDSEVLNRLEHLKRQLKDKEALLQEHVHRHHHEPASAGHMDEPTRSIPFHPAPVQRNHSATRLLSAARVHHRDSPTNSEKMRRILQSDDDQEYKPSYFRDDAILMGGGSSGHDYPLTKRVDSADHMFSTNLEREATRRRHNHVQPNSYDMDDPTSMANFELNRIAEQNDQRLKKLRDLENDDASLVDSNEVLERFQRKQRLQRGGSQTTLQDDAWLK